MYNQLYTTKNMVYAGGGYIIMFYAIKLWRSAGFVVLRMSISIVTVYSDVYSMCTFLCVLSMVYGLREICVFVVCLKIRLFALYARLCSLGTIISGTP